ncbi:MAG: MarR family EPS-associated transcriptional regulator [Pseudomonadota bacterium]
MNEESHYKLLKLLEENPEASQRDMAAALGVSLGKVNYCLKALIERGHVKAGNFKNSDNKAAYLYLLTPKGVKAKASITVRYLQRKLDEYESLKTEIAELKREVKATNG